MFKRLLLALLILAFVMFAGMAQAADVGLGVGTAITDRGNSDIDTETTIIPHLSVKQAIGPVVAKLYSKWELTDDLDHIVSRNYTATVAYTVTGCVVITGGYQIDRTPIGDGKTIDRNLYLADVSCNLSF